MAYENYDTHAPAYAQISVTTSAQKLSTILLAAGVTFPSWANEVILYPENGAIRYRCDGTDPTTTVGMPIPSSSWWPAQGSAALAAMSLISQSGTVSVSIEFRG